MMKGYSAQNFDKIYIFYIKQCCHNCFTTIIHHQLSHRIIDNSPFVAPKFKRIYLVFSYFSCISNFI